MQRRAFPVCGSCPLYILRGFSEIRAADVVETRETRGAPVHVLQSDVNSTEPGERGLSLNRERGGFHLVSAEFGLSQISHL